MKVHFLNTEQVLLWNISTPLWRSIFENQWKCSYEIFLLHYGGQFLKTSESAPMRYFYSNMAVHFWYPENVLLWDLIHYDGPFLISREFSPMRSNPLWRSIFEIQRKCSYEIFYSTIAVHFLNTEQVLLWNISTPLWRSIFENQWKCSYDIFLFHYDGPFLKTIKSAFMRYFYSKMAVHFWYPENVLLWDQIHYDGLFLNSRERAPMR
jgi:hypothetical protein